MLEADKVVERRKAQRESDAKALLEEGFAGLTEE